MTTLKLGQNGAWQKRGFISYSHDSEGHKNWVRSLAEYLLENGIDVVLDQWDVAIGDDLPAFMEQAIRNTDRVIAICTDAYVAKANSGAGGVGCAVKIAGRCASPAAGRAGGTTRP
jgi:hypothetical protein